MSKKEKLIILGITGSVGESAVRVLHRYPERFELVAFSYHSNFEAARKLAEQFSVKNVCCTLSHCDEAEQLFWRNNGTFFDSMEDLVDIDYDKVLISVVGAAGARTTFKAASSGKTILLANKESLVVCGEFIMQRAKQYNTTILPVDSEHNSVFRLLPAFSQGDSIMLTASGGPLREKSVAEIENASISEVLNHPTWNMGNKITVDSAGMINKALEIIEAHHLFNCPCEEIEAVIHPQSIVHAMLKKPDGSVIMHASFPDMIYPVAHAMFYPEEPVEPVPPKPVFDFPLLQFLTVPAEKFPGFFLGRKAGDAGGVSPAIFNAANEAAVELFLSGHIKFADIPRLIDAALQKNPFANLIVGLETTFEADGWARQYIRQIANQ